MNKRYLMSLAMVLLLPMMSGCLGGDGDSDTIVLYGFSVKGELIDNKVIHAFRERYKADTGRDIKFQTVYAGSGTVTKQVIVGAPAEVMILSTEWDALQLRDAGLVTTDWRSYPHEGTFSTSPWVILTRPGNPKGIHDFSDLARSDVRLVSADPITSGGAQWSIFAIYGSELRRTSAIEGSPNETRAVELLDDIVDNVDSWQESARKALSQFVFGYGDAFITYENEALLGLSQGEGYEIVYPRSTILSEHKAIIVDGNVDEKERGAVEAFMEYLFSDEVQDMLSVYDFRSPDERYNDGFERIEDPFTVEYLGGWGIAKPEIIDGIYAPMRG